MKALLRCLAVQGLLIAALPVFAATHYVSVNSTNPVAPYTNWATAANVIQNAVDAASSGDTVLVTNGVYDTGGKAVYGLITNRVAVDKALSLLSVNGPEFTIIQGHQVPGTTNGDGAIRCAYLTNGAALIGFTLTNGATRSSGDFEREQGGGAVFCESTNARVFNCVISGNSANAFGGGVFNGMLRNSLVFRNSSNGSGGGAAEAVLLNCTVVENFAAGGGGVSRCTVINSIVRYNGIHLSLSEDNHSRSTVFDFSCTTLLPGSGLGNIDLNPLLADAYHLNADSPCRGAGNLAFASGTDLDGEPWGSPPSMGCDEFYSFSVTGPLSVGILSSETKVPVGFDVAFRGMIDGLSAASAWDFGDGTIVSNEPWTSHQWSAPGDYPVTLTAFNDTFPAGGSSTVMVQVVELPIHYVDAVGTNPVPPYVSWATAATNIQDAVDAASVPGAVVLVANGVYDTGGKALHGNMTNRVAVDKLLNLLSVNGPEFTIIQGYQIPDTTNGDGAIRCVYLTNGAVLSGFTLTGGATLSSGDSWLERSGGGVVCESTAAWVSNCVMVGNSAHYGGGGSFWGTLRDCRITENTADAGGGAYFGTLVSCVVNGNHSRGSLRGGGGVRACTVYECIISNNSSSSYGGGSAFGTLDNCLLVGNSAAMYGGGGAYGGILNNCTVIGNSVQSSGGGGVYDVTAYNCVVYYNSAFSSPNHAVATLDYSCSDPLPSDGVGNTTNAPIFADTNGWSNLRLQSNSPCINAGDNTYVTTTTDLDGNPRVMGGTVDMGAYEFQSPQSMLSYAWLQQYGLPTDGSADYAHSDTDSHNNWQEWKAWTDPTNELSVLRMLSPESGTKGTVVSWQSVNGHSYMLERATNANAQFSLLQGNIVGEAGTTSFTDTNVVGSGPHYYRVGVPE